MKVKFDIECTPQEARTFFGLPDVSAMQDKLLDELEDQLRENIRSLDPETLAKTWMPTDIQGWSEMQKMFWGQMGGAAGASSKANQDES
jgi:hypothetical protein